MPRAAKKADEDDILKAAMAKEAEDTEAEHESDGPAAPVVKVASAKGKKVEPLQQEAMIAYHPGDEDAPVTIWFRMKFRANVAIKVTNPELIALAKQNPWFSVDGVRAPMPVKKVRPRDTSEDAMSGLPPGFNEKQEVELADEHAD